MAGKVKPIGPKGLIKKRKNGIPNEVFEVFNELIAKKFNGESAVVYQDEVMKLLVAKGLKREEVFEQHWLDVEDNYRSAGWDVEYDKPAYNETYEAHFIFSLEEK